MTRGIVTAGGGHGWETRVVAALGRPGATLSVIRRCADMADVLALASTGQIAACLVAADLRRLDSESVHQLALFGVAVVAIHRAADERAPTLLGRLGVAAALPDDIDTDAIIAAVDRVVGSSSEVPPMDASPLLSDPTGALPAPHRPAEVGRSEINGAASAPEPGVPAGTMDIAGGERGRAARHRSPDMFRRRRDRRAPDPRGSAAGRLPGHVPAPSGSARQPGRVIAVWGPTGAPGRSTVAMGLADRFAVAGDRVLLVDADVYGGILSSAFGLLDESAGLAGACRLAAHGRLDPAELAKLCWSVSDRLELLTGIARADRWPELRPSAIPMVLDVARSRADYVMVDCSAVLETDEEITFDTMAPRRNGATIAALREADLVLAVASADPPGMERLARGMAELATARDGSAGGATGSVGSARAVGPAAGLPAQVVLNRVRSSAASVGELTEAVRRFCARDPIALLPEDRTNSDLAWRRGVPVAEVAPKSPLVRGLGELAERLRNLLGTTSSAVATAAGTRAAGGR